LIRARTSAWGSFESTLRWKITSVRASMSPETLSRIAPTPWPGVTVKVFAISRSRTSTFAADSPPASFGCWPWPASGACPSRMTRVSTFAPFGTWPARTSTVRVASFGPSASWPLTVMPAASTQATAAGTIIRTRRIGSSLLVWSFGTSPRHPLAPAPCPISALCSLLSALCLPPPSKQRAESKEQRAEKSKKPKSLNTSASPRTGPDSRRPDTRPSARPPRRR
jgi:hypothetical protein